MYKKEIVLDNIIILILFLFLKYEINNFSLYFTWIFTTAVVQILYSVKFDFKFKYVLGIYYLT